MRSSMLTAAAICCLLLAPAAGADVPQTDGRTAAGAAQTEPLRLDKWTLHQKSGAELYRELCASCHGRAGLGAGEGGAPLAVPAPALARLERRGIPKAHWAYVILAPYDDEHHRGPDGVETMPCWNRIFRHALGSDAASRLVAAKLVDHLETIQQ